jgi:glycosyltransferase involved in cell wall biosynthesis
VSTRIGGVPEVAPEGRVAWFCEPASAPALAAAMQAAASSPNLAAMGQAAREIAEARYGTREMYRNYEGVFLPILKRRRRE